MCVFFVFFFKQKTAYEIRPCDWSSDVCSSDLRQGGDEGGARQPAEAYGGVRRGPAGRDCQGNRHARDVTCPSRCAGCCRSDKIGAKRVRLSDVGGHVRRTSSSLSDRQSAPKPSV